MPLTVGEAFAGFRIAARLDGGRSWGAYLVDDPRTGRRHALYVERSDLPDDQRHRDAVIREAELAATLSHRNIPQVYDVGETDGRLWVSAAYVQGSSAADMLLHDRYRAGLPPDEVLAIIGAAASALDHANHVGLLHRDVTPAAIVITDAESPDGRIHLMGFGRAGGVDDAPGLTADDSDLDAVAYASPELLLGEDANGRSDQYALACTAFHLLTGSTPYPSTNAAVIVNKHVMAPPPSIGERRPDMARLDGVFATAMAKDAGSRYPTCVEFADQLGKALLAAPESLPDGSLAANAAEASETLQTVRPGPADARPMSKSRRKIRNRWWRRRTSGQPWSRRKIAIAALATVGILAIVATTLAAMLTPLLMPESGPAPRTAAAPPPAPPVIGRPLEVRLVLDPPLVPGPGQCPLPAPPAAPSPQEPLQACGVDDAAVYRLGPVAVRLSLTGATSAKLPTSESHTVQLSMDATSSASFARYTAANVGRQLALVRDGVVLAAPSITQPIDGETLQISGELSAATADTIARKLRDGT